MGGELSPLLVGFPVGQSSSPPSTTSEVGIKSCAVSHLKCLYLISIHPSLLPSLPSSLRRRRRGRFQLWGNEKSLEFRQEKERRLRKSDNSKVATEGWMDGDWEGWDYLKDSWGIAPKWVPMCRRTGTVMLSPQVPRESARLSAKFICYLLKCLI